MITGIAKQESRRTHNGNFPEFLATTGMYSGEPQSLCRHHCAAEQWASPQILGTDKIASEDSLQQPATGLTACCLLPLGKPCRRT